MSTEIRDESLISTASLESFNVSELVSSFSAQELSEIRETVKYEEEYYKGQLSDDEKEGIVAGSIFEVLNARERKIDEAATDAIKEQLLDIITEPKGPFSEALRTFRKPDLIDIKYSKEEEKYVIEGLTEITHGKLGNRKGEQLIYLREDLSEMLSIIQDTLRENSLPEYETLAEVIDNMEVSPQLTLELVLSKDKEGMPPWELYTMDNEYYEEVTEMIDEGLIKISYSKYDKDTLLKLAAELAPSI